ncbi:MAG TPA: DUF5131 family protein [Anaeromyxobacteraceae bacterium]|nr:DUF5131 family protein [Anaeromyxobacteraceae bacterium]
MAKTSIEWTGETWNPLKGCQRVSPGCGGPHNEGGCYAERQAIRQAGPGGAYEGLIKSTPNGPRWTGAVAVDEDKLLEPFSWRKRRTVFVDSMSDLFFEGFTDEQVARAIQTMALTTHITYQVLTKRAERMEKLLNSDAFWAKVATDPAGLAMDPETFTRPLPNVWWGVSCEDRKHGLPRLHHLRRTPAAVRFVSFEPLLEDPGVFHALGGPDEDGHCLACGLGFGPPHEEPGSHECPPGFGGRIHWAIIGGESGPRSRPCDLAWIRALVARCRAAGVAPFVKQLGAHVCDSFFDPARAVLLKHKKGGDPSEWPEDLRIREFPEVSRG